MLTPEQIAEEAEISLGLLPFKVAGQLRKVPELKWRANREWQARLEAEFVRLVSVAGDTPEGLRVMADAQRDLILAYDQTHALGDLEDATERELDTIYERLLEVAYPKPESQTALAITVFRQVAASVRENSKNGPSPSGTTAAPTSLKDHLPSGKSGSSTRRRRSA